MSRSHPSTSPPLDPNDPFVRLLGADERHTARPEFRAALRDRLLTLTPAPGVPIDAPLIGRVVLRPVPALVAAALGTALIAAVWVMQPVDRDGFIPPPPVDQREPAAPLPAAAAPAVGSVRVRPPSSAAELRATIADRSAVDRPVKRPATSTSAAERDDVVPARAAHDRRHRPPTRSRPAVEGAPLAGLPVPPAPADAASVAPPRNPSSDGGRDRGRPAAAPSATATTNAADASGGAGATSPALLPPEPAEPTPAPVVAMPTVPVAPTPTPGP